MAVPGSAAVARIGGSMRRHITVLVLAASAAGTAGAGLTAHWIMSDERYRRIGVHPRAAHPPAGPRTGNGTQDGKHGAKQAEAVAAGTAPKRLFNAPRLRRAVRAYVATRPGRAGVMVTDLRTGLSFGDNEKGRFVTASIMKVDILTGLLLQRQRQDRNLSPGERDLAQRMIRESDNAAADALYARSGYGPGVRTTNRSLGLRETAPWPTSWGSSMTTPADQVRLLGTLARSRSPLGGPARRYVLRLMGSVLREQSWGVSAAARPGERVALKNGWAPIYHQGHGWAVNSIGRITGPGHDFLLAVCSMDSPTMEAGVSTVEHVADLVVSRLRE